MKPLKLLVCSANLGNADPSASLDLLLPEDGLTGEILRHSKYPIVENKLEFGTGEDSLKSEKKGSQQEPKNGEDGEQATEKFDIIVLGLQESTWDPSEMESAVPNQQKQESFGSDKKSAPSMLTDSVHSAAKKASKAVEKVNTLAISRDNTKGEENSDSLADGTAILHNALGKRLPSFNRTLSFQRGQMRLLIYTSQKNHTFELTSVRAQNTGKGGLANKGGIVGEVCVDGTTKLAFMSCHLEAHEGIDKFKARCSSLGTILGGTKKYAVPEIYPDASLASHFCFVLGDLNFRTRCNGSIRVEEQLDDVKKLISEKNWNELNSWDELRLALENQLCLTGFNTLYCNFPPTFKVERHKGYVYKDQRTPSYTDRVLWKAGDLLEKKIKPTLYEPVDEFSTSDHKPIRAAFEIRLNRHLAFHSRADLLTRRSATFGHNLEKREHLHLFLCDIQCDIFQGVEDPKPSTYVCLVSDPAEILLSPPTSLQQCFDTVRKFFRVRRQPLFDSEKPIGGAAPIGWPRTDVREGTQNPKWENEAIHCILRRHFTDGSPIELSGALLHIFVFQYSKRQVDSVIGSYTVNLENLYRSVVQTEPLTKSENKSLGWWGQSSRFLGLMSNRNLATPAEVASAEDKIISLEINGPLLKDGSQVGVLRANLDAWWVDEEIGGGARGSDGKPLTLEKQMSMDASYHSTGSLTGRHRRGTLPANREE